ncbi:MAG: hypothetical protein UZ15_CFX003002511 [Chloroflexi bacterium OLB15]|nr:MAG: hypothetical protein UZ15_CFX003002511 [Chloroflexi bacterium OLB15]
MAINWSMPIPAQLPPTADAGVVELDKLFSFIGEKNESI